MYEAYLPRFCAKDLVALDACQGDVHRFLQLFAEGAVATTRDNIFKAWEAGCDVPWLLEQYLHLDLWEYWGEQTQVLKTLHEQASKAEGTIPPLKWLWSDLAMELFYLQHQRNEAVKQKRIADTPPDSEPVPPSLWDGKTQDRRVIAMAQLLNGSSDQIRSAWYSVVKEVLIPLQELVRGADDAVALERRGARRLLDEARLDRQQMCLEHAQLAAAKSKVEHLDRRVKELEKALTESGNREHAQLAAAKSMVEHLDRRVKELEKALTESGNRNAELAAKKKEIMELYAALGRNDIAVTQMEDKLLEAANRAEFLEKQYHNVKLALIMLLDHLQKTVSFVNPDWHVDLCNLVQDAEKQLLRLNVLGKKTS